MYSPGLEQEMMELPICIMAGINWCKQRNEKGSIHWDGVHHSY